MQDLEHRRLYLYGSLFDIDAGEDPLKVSSPACALAEHIMEFNRIDIASKTENPEPIRLYINSPGGDITEGFTLIDAICMSKTPVWTINIGQCSSMAFLISISGHRRFSFPSASFLMHDGTSGAIDSTNKMQDRVKFNMRFEKEVVRAHILSHGKMSKKEYDKLERVEFYMLPKEALRYGFIDEIVTDISAIL
jgi:ATP-dependent Clp protease protease subunit